MNLEEKKAVVRESEKLIVRHVFDRTVVIGIMKNERLVDHGTGMLLRIDDNHLVITAAHVIKNIDPNDIQIISTEYLSNRRLSPGGGDLYGGDIEDVLDVGFLRMNDPNSVLEAGKKFLTLEDFDVFPTGLDVELAILFGMPESLHEERTPDSHTFPSLAYLTQFPGDIDWTAPGNRPATVWSEYDEIIDDVFTGQPVKLPPPFGMSSGGLWRADLSRGGIWTPDRIQLIGILTEFHEDKRMIKANRIENIYHLLERHFTLPSLY